MNHDVMFPSWNFQGLEDQLLSVIVKHEKPQLEMRRETLIQDTRWSTTFKTN